MFEYFRIGCLGLGYGLLHQELTCSGKKYGSPAMCGGATSTKLHVKFGLNRNKAGTEGDLTV